MANGELINPGPSERISVADAILSDTANETDRSKNKYKGIRGGWSKPHDSPHLTGLIPQVGNALFLDGHASLQKFQKMKIRTDGSAPSFWW